MNVPEGHLQSILPIQYSRDLHTTPQSDTQINKEIAVPTCRERVAHRERGAQGCLESRGTKWKPTSAACETYFKLSNLN